MAIGIDEIDDEELEQDDIVEPQEVPVNEFFLKEVDNDDDYPDLTKEDDTENGSNDAITLYLKDNGIEDPDKIKFTDDEGNVLERAWSDLSSEELLNILRSNLREPETGLDDEEIAFINSLRLQGISPSEYIQGLQDLMLQQLQNQANLMQASLLQQEPVYTSDLLTDDELFILDLQARVPDITDEEITEALTKAKDNENLYQKLMAGIRSEYERLEQETRDRENAIATQELLEAYQLYSNAVINEISNLSEIGDLDINMDSDDMDELADFILSSDDAGVNYFSKALQDPQTLVRMAWFALHGEEIFNGISDYYNKQIQEASRAGYLLGLYAGQPQYNQEQPTVVVQHKEPTTKNQERKAKSISDLDDEL